MQTDSIITNTISDEIRQKGHKSIRFSADGFSILLADASFVPVYLKKFTFSSPTADNILSDECMRVLKEENLLPFEGETVFISDSLDATLVPEPFFTEEQGETILRSAFDIGEDDLILSRKMKHRAKNMLYAFSSHFQKLEMFYPNGIKVLHSGECMISLSDQVSASDHQRGFLMIEVQNQKMEILVIKGDQIVLSNRYFLKQEKDYIYHTLNTMKQLGLDPESVPVFYAGRFEADSDPGRLLSKYVRKTDPVPYFLEGVDRAQKIEFLLLSEASKCV